MYARILIPLDSSDLAEQVIPFVRILGNSLQSPVDLMSVIQEIPVELTASLSVDQNDITASWRRQAQNYLEEISGQLRKQGLETSFVISQGDTAS